MTESEASPERRVMNPDNYASLEASKRLVDAGIVLEADCYWVKDGLIEEWCLVSAIERDESYAEDEFYPAPSLAEVWRELPETSKIYKLSEGMSEISYPHKYDTSFCSFLQENANPTDALIDLLIWTRSKP
jgi:hypothetical protein